MRTFTRTLILLITITLTACAGFEKSWKHRGDSQAHGLLAFLRVAKDILKDEFGKAQECIKAKGEFPQELNLTGQMTVQSGYLFISEIHPANKSTQLSRDQSSCISQALQRPKMNIANGILYHPALLKRDFIYEFSGSVFPEVKGTVKSADYDEVRDF
jgi:hypothetical protein